MEMCTAATYKTKDFYMGRTLDYEFSYGDEITVTPRNYPFHFSHMEELENHYAIIGMAHVADDYPLYYDAVNEKGLGMAGLNFVGNAVYQEIQEGRENVAQFEFIPWILSQCASVEEAKKMLEEMNLVGTVFAPQFPAAQLHWILADKYACITIECVREGLKVYDNPAGVLTNNPPFEQQMFLLNQYMHLSPKQPENHFRAVAITDLQPRHGCTWTSGRSFFYFPLCKSGIYQSTCSIGRFRGGKRQPVFPHSGIGGPAARML